MSIKKEKTYINTPQIFIDDWGVENADAWFNKDLVYFANKIFAEEKDAVEDFKEYRKTWGFELTVKNLLKNYYKS